MAGESVAQNTKGLKMALDAETLNEQCRRQFGVDLLFSPTSMNNLQRNFEFK
jgi:hypothetical protein